jgi:hypothetical protein
MQVTAAPALGAQQPTYPTYAPYRLAEELVGFTSCPLCLELLELDSEDPIISHGGDGDKHPGHAGCLKGWFAKDTVVHSCPSCRINVDVSSLFSRTERIWAFLQALESSLEEDSFLTAPISSSLVARAITIGALATQVLEGNSGALLSATLISAKWLSLFRGVFFVNQLLSQGHTRYIIHIDSQRLNRLLVAYFYAPTFVDMLDIVPQPLIGCCRNVMAVSLYALSLFGASSLLSCPDHGKSFVINAVTVGLAIVDPHSFLAIILGEYLLGSSRT